jgi:hypothetical protein
MSIDVKLPPLPESEYGLCFYDEGGIRAADEAGYTQRQMEEHARAAVLADRAASNRVLRMALEALHRIGMSAGWQYATFDTRNQCEAAIAAIRAHLGETP